MEIPKRPWNEFSNARLPRFCGLIVHRIHEKYKTMKKFFSLATLAYLLPTFPLGYAWHLVVFKDAYDRLDLLRTEVIVPFGLTSMFVQALIFAWAYPKLFSTRRADWLASAARFAGVFAMLAWSFAILPAAAKYQMSSVTEFLKLETAFTLLQFAIVSPLIALACRDGERARGGEPKPRGDLPSL
jgi:hypothetical protein